MRRTTLALGACALAVSALAAPTVPMSTAAAPIATGPAIAASTAAAAAGWTSPRAVQPGVDPVLTFSPSGAAAIGSETTPKGKPAGTDIDLATDGTTFAKSPWTLSGAGQGQVLDSLALSTDGSIAAGFASATRPAPVFARVAKPAPSSFVKAQQLIAAGGATRSQAGHDNLELVATSDGEIVGAGENDAGDLYTASLSAGDTAFSVARAPKALSATDDYTVAADRAGDAFLAGDGANGCTTVAFRAPHASFTQTYATGNCASATPNLFDAITANGRGQAALLSEDVSESGTGVSRLLAQVGRDGHFGSAIQLGGALGGPVGVASDTDGEVTAAWTGCDAGPIVNGQLSETDCAIDAATGSLSHGFSAKAATGTQLESAGSGALSAITADRGVAVSSCHAAGCSFSVFTAAPGGGFRSGHFLGSGKQLIALTGDDHGDLLAVWASGSDQVYAATGSAASGSWSAPHRVTGAGISPTAVTAHYGPDRRALVAWSTGGETYAAGFSP